MPVFSDGQKITEALVWNRLIQSFPTSYVVWKDNSTYRAESLLKDGTDYSGSDSAAVINSAIGALPSVGGKIFLRTGARYTLADEILINKSYVTLEGEVFAGSDSTGVELWLNSDVNKNIIEVKGTSLGHISLRNLYLRGNSAGNPDQSVDGEQCGIYMKAVTFFDIENVIARDCTRQGIYLASSSYGAVRNSVARNCTREGFAIDATTKTDLISCVAYSNTRYGLDISTNANMEFAVGVYGGSFMANTMGGITVRNYGAGTYTRDVKIISASTWDNELDGICVEQSKDIHVDGCTSYGNDRSGILADDMHQSTLVNNKCFDNNDDNDEATWGNGISLKESTHNLVGGNHLFDKDHSNQNYAVREYGDSNDTNDIINNFCLNNQTIDVDNHGTLVRFNPGFNPIGKITNAFDTTNDKIELEGDAAAPAASTDYVICHADILISSTDSGSSDNAILIKDASDNQINAAALSTLDAFYIPVGYKINWGAYTGAAPTVVVGFQ
jgi:parallel beta-helix repeat protein